MSYYNENVMKLIDNIGLSYYNENVMKLIDNIGPSPAHCTRRQCHSSRIEEEEDIYLAQTTIAQQNNTALPAHGN